MVQFGANVVQCDALIAESLPLQFVGKRIQIKILNNYTKQITPIATNTSRRDIPSQNPSTEDTDLEPFGSFKDLFDGARRIGVFIVVLEGIYSHLSSPLVSLRVDTRSIQNFDVRLGTVTQRVRVDPDETGAINEHLRQTKQHISINI